MSSNITEIAIEERLTPSNPLGCHPRRNTVRCALWAPYIARASADGYSRRGGRGQEAELENERSSEPIPVVT